MLLAAFAGGAFGASIGALPAFSLAGLAVVAGELYRLAARTAGAAPAVDVTGAIGFGVVLGPHVAFAPWPSSRAHPDEACAAVADAWDRAATPIGAVLVEPVQGRGGVRIPPDGFLSRLRSLCDTRGALLITDEILTGLGRCGARWQAIAQGTVPDLTCVGKALGGGMPVSACLGRAEPMAAWGEPAGEALHTGTFFGHPLACAAALTALEILEEHDLAARAQRTGHHLVDALRRVGETQTAVREVRGAGLLIGIELD
jgi:acetylornithine/succinyldiaminopimelate/putrescine aminotransferase